MTDEAMSPLRRRMIEDMSIRKFAPKTQTGLYPHTSRTSPLPRPIARHGELRGRAPLSVASGRRAARVRRPSTAPCRRCGSSSTSRSSDPTSSSSCVRARAAQAAGRAEPGGGGALAGGGTGAQVQGGAERRLWRGPARLRGRLAEGGRYRLQAHAASASSKAKAARIATRCSRRICSSCCATGGASRDRRAGCFPARTRSTR